MDLVTFTEENLIGRRIFLRNEIVRSNPLEVFCKNVVLRNFAEVTEKHHCLSLFFNKAAGLGLQLYLKKNFGTVVFLLILPNFKEHLFLQNITKRLLLNSIPMC